MCNIWDQGVYGPFPRGLSFRKIYHCDHCEQLVFFENIACLSCGHPLAFLPDIYAIGSLAPAKDGTLQCPAPAAASALSSLR